MHHGRVAAWRLSSLVLFVAFSLSLTILSHICRCELPEIRLLSRTIHPYSKENIAYISNLKDHLNVKRNFLRRLTPDLDSRDLYLVVIEDLNDRHFVAEILDSRLEHVDKNGFLVYTSKIDDLLDKRSINLWVEPILPSDKLSRELHPFSNFSEHTNGDVPNELVITLLPFSEHLIMVGSPLANFLMQELKKIGIDTNILAISPRKLNLLFHFNEKYAFLTFPMFPELIIFISIESPQKTVFRALSLLSIQKDVYFIEKNQKVTLSNKFAAEVSQVGVGVEGSVISTPIWDKGLRGEGQLIGVGDTGIDMRNCLFSDENINLQPNMLTPNHRKVVLYHVVEGADFGDVLEGHGTHVAGIVSGSTTSQNEMEQYEGIAPNSKLVFVDIGKSDNSIVLPNNLYSNYLDIFHQNGARISSHSWNAECTSSTPAETECNRYDSRAETIDEFMYDHDDHLVIFSAGNIGSHGLHSVSTPGTSKNAISVGASLSSKKSWNALCSLNMGSFYAAACNIYNREEQDGEGIADFSSRGFTLPDYRLKPDLVAPGFYIISARSRAHGVSGPPLCNAHICESNVNGPCPANAALIPKRGTSMSAPIIAGSAALIRQYLSEGYYPSGSRNASNSMSNPPASLLKAMLIHSTVKVTGSTVDSFSRFISLNQLSSLNPYEGFGRIQLDQVLSFEESPFKLFIVNDSVSNSNSQKFCVSVTYHNNVQQSSFKVTLAWTDPKGNIYSGNALVNDLDLIVEDDIGNRYYGNDVEMKKVKDRSNNVERVTIPSQFSSIPITRNFSIEVHGHYVFTERQKFSLVATGQQLAHIGECPPPIDRCPNNCSSIGVCNNGTCECPSNYFGYDCSQQRDMLHHCVTKKTLISSVTPKTFTFSFETTVSVDLYIVFSRPFSHSYHPLSVVRVYVSTSSNVSQTEYIATNQAGSLFPNFVTIFDAPASTYHILLTNTRSIEEEIYITAFTRARGQYHQYATFGLNSPPITGCIASIYSNQHNTHDGQGTVQHITHYVNLTLSSLEFSSNVLMLRAYFITDGNVHPIAYISRDSMALPGMNYRDYSPLTPARPLVMNDVPVNSEGLFIAIQPHPTSGNRRYMAGTFTLVVTAIQRCFGSQLVTQNNGYIQTQRTSTVGNLEQTSYAANTNCEWRIEAPEGQRIRFEFRQFSISIGDSVRVYDGDDSGSSNLIGTFNGYYIPAPIVSSSRNLVVVFNSDNSMEAEGFTAYYEFISLTCTNQCSNNGICIGGECRCFEGYYGTDCSQQGCPTPTCSSRGVCIDNQYCACYNGYWGPNCEGVCPGGHTNPCYGHGRCNQTGQCECFGSRFGQLCESIACSPNCQGTCDHESGTCVCMFGQWGTNCEQNCPGALGAPCNLRGQCSQTGECRCQDLYFGLACENRNCSSPCQNGGTCNYINGVCSCLQGYWSSDCSNECPGGVHNFCNQRGSCDQEGGFCICNNPNHSGDLCEIVVPERDNGDTGTQPLDFPGNHREYMRLYIKKAPPAEQSEDSILELSGIARYLKGVVSPKISSPMGENQGGVLQFRYTFVVEQSNEERQRGGDINGRLHIYIASEYAPSIHRSEENFVVTSSNQFERLLNTVPQGHQSIYVLVRVIGNENVVFRMYVRDDLGGVGTSLNPIQRDEDWFEENLGIPFEYALLILIVLVFFIFIIMLLLCALCCILCLFIRGKPEDEEKDSQFIDNPIYFERKKDIEMRERKKKRRSKAKSKKLTREPSHMQ